MAIYQNLSWLGLMLGAALLFYLTAQRRQSFTLWPFFLPWGEFTRYLKKIDQEFGFLNTLGFGQQIALYVLNAHNKAKGSGPNAESSRQAEYIGKAFDLENIIRLAQSEKKALLLIGAPASGKTTLLQVLAVRSIQRDLYHRFGFSTPRIPFYVPVKEINFDSPFLEAVHQTLSQSNSPISKRGLQQAIRSRRAFFLFDGLDEIAFGNPRRKACEWIEKVQSWCGIDIPLVVTCRAEALLEDVKFNFPYLTVAIRNFALQQFRSLRAVSESRVPPRFFNSFEEKTEYLLVTPPSLPAVLRGAKKSAPTYYYYLAKFPVTNSLYRKFIEATQHRAPAFWDDPQFNGDDLPVVGVDWEDAEAYCHWLTEQEKQVASSNQWQLQKEDDTKGNFASSVVYRLPLEEEWEWAASGGKRKFPWGDTPPQKKHANFNEPLQGLSPVNAHPEGATPEGVMDMAGNIWEWTATWWDEKKEQRVLRGGACFNEESALRCTARHGNYKKPWRFVGFRVARIVVDK
jgi:hypothetical protein